VSVDALCLVGETGFDHKHLLGDRSFVDTPWKIDFRFMKDFCFAKKVFPWGSNNYIEVTAALEVKALPAENVSIFRIIGVGSNAFHSPLMTIQRPKLPYIHVCVMYLSSQCQVDEHFGKQYDKDASQQVAESDG